MFNNTNVNGNKCYTCLVRTQMLRLIDKVINDKFLMVGLNVMAQLKFLVLLMAVFVDILSFCYSL